MRSDYQETPDMRRSLTIFISSPFSEPAGQRWSLRETLRGRLRGQGHKAWLYEIDAKEYRRTGLTPREIIIDAIESCDLVITLYKSRAGSLLDDEPFYATAFETFHARRLGKKVYLHVLDGCQRPRLRGVLSVFEYTLPLPNRIAKHGSESDLVEAVLSEVAQYREDRLPRNLVATDLCSPEALANDRDWLHGIHTSLGAARNLWQASETAAKVPLLQATSRLRKENSLNYGRILSTCAGVWANQAKYDRAIEFGWAAVRIFMESGYLYEMIAEIQAVSGILNMANQIRKAYWVNTFGLQSASRLRTAQLTSLLPAFNDSRGSIMRKLGKLSSSRERIRQSVPTVGEGSAYTLAKYGSALALLGGKANVDTAFRLIYDVALPLALSQGQSVGYVYRDAARLALLVGDDRMAAHNLAEAESSCRKNGQLHTLEIVQRMKVEAALH